MAKASDFPSASRLDGHERLLALQDGGNVLASVGAAAEQGFATRGIVAGPGRAVRLAKRLAGAVVWGVAGAGKRLALGLDERMRLLTHGMVLTRGASLETDEGHGVLAGSGRFPWSIVGRGGRPVVGLDRNMALHVHAVDLGDAQLQRGVSVSNYPWAVTGRGGRPVVALDRDLNLQVNGLDLGAALMRRRTTNWDHAVVGRSGQVMFGFRDGDVELAHVGPSARLRMLFRDAQNLGRSRSIDRPHGAAINPLSAKRQLLISAGQSLSCGYQSWPSLSTTARADCFSIGTSVRPQDSISARFLPIGDGALHPLVATVEPQGVSGRSSLSPAQVAALPAGNLAEGEAPIVAATRHLARSWVQQGWAPARTWVAVAVGVGGRTVEELSAGANPNLYARATDALALFTGLASAAGEPGHVAAITWMQGEDNYARGDRTQAGYKAKLAAWRTRLSNDVLAATGQPYYPPLLTYQTSGSYARDDVQLSIGMAQWELSREDASVFMVGPTYPVTDEGGHLDANGSRWFGALTGKVLERVLVRGLEWEPLAPLWIEQVGRTVYLGMHVPAPPLAFDLPYALSAAVDFPDKGFRVEDGAGFVPISSVEILGATIVALTCERAPGAGGYVWAGDQTVHGGMTCVRDSDGSVADDPYTFTGGTGMAPEANIPALIGRPYPLQNWLINFRLPIGWSRS